MGITFGTMVQDSDVHTCADYGSYIHVHNKTNVDIGLDDSGIEEGEWAPGCPPNTIEAGREGIIHLKDKWGLAGSKGFTAYQLYPPKGNKPVTVLLEFADPYSPSDDNYLHAKSSKPSQVSVNVLSYQSKGHPFTAHVEIYLAGDEEHSDDMEAQFKIGFDTVGGLLHWQPVHEEIAIAAFIRSNLHFPRGVTYNNLDAKQWEYVRGLVWPDDPSCLLFKNTPDNNHKFDLGDDFLGEFKGGNKSSMTRRSHFGDLQLLHGMASDVGEDPNKTKKNILTWLEVMYKLAVGTEINERDLLCEKLPGSFSASTSGNQTLRDLLLGRTREYRKVDISRRALGVCLHMIQDSYAVGHTLRRLKNVNDLQGRDKDGFIHFKSGTHAQLGPLITFHTYTGQGDRHDHYDDSDDERKPRDVETFNKIIGARDAIDKCTTLINFFAAKTKWNDGVSDFLDNDVYKLDEKVTSSNAQVDERFGLPETSGVMATTAAEEDEEYRVGMERKMLLLEGGLAYAQPQAASGGMLDKLRVRMVGTLKYCLAIALFVIIFLFFNLLPHF
ncbi:serine protease abc transporter b family tagd [Pyrenophora seminiperda CCB06]|uniref:Serine protease abc transporter b family tagd n=1 Tax=Pyrenophora seminiperda CCB06 TaxID=1302712 RepID=A0A3M7MEB0_9PLEO|nr:serine protease abc transporter b family tagd [Pyrenophora seminiperda CCB06]